MSPLLDLLDLFHLVLEAFAVDLVLDLLLSLELSCILLLVQLEELLPLLELLLLLLKLFSHACLPLLDVNFLSLLLLVRLQHCVLVQSCPLIDLVFEA